ncbi:MAG: PEGA domain-containing protein [Candidatus Nitrohelix vancouverensis]|uniref:PEGA domain-containing protein n=1 Tax=Candidatus Nitrohelix vancouverensis TaxID=2705534 RepID=A0A7T0C3N6_9BACT|nr:MAG: PEGA domain-containing protein [Candidatus Nitrohelix vancouverensis]
MKLLYLIFTTLWLFFPYTVYSQSDHPEFSVRSESGGLIGYYQNSAALIFDLCSASSQNNNLFFESADPLLGVQNLLEAKGFKVIRAQGRDNLQTVFRKFSVNYGQSPASRLLFYAACSSQDTGLAHHADIFFKQSQTPAMQDTSKANAKSLIEWSQTLRSRQVLLVFEQAIAYDSFSEKQAIAKSTTSDSGSWVRQILTSARFGANSESADLFRRSFIQGLSGDADRNADHVIGVGELSAFIQWRVARDSHWKQAPQYGELSREGKTAGDFMFPDRPTLFPRTTDQSAPPILLNGYLKLTSNAANAEVYINGQFYGRVAKGQVFVSNVLPSGLSKLKVKAPGFALHEEMIVIDRNAWSEIHVELRPALEEPSQGIRDSEDAVEDFDKERLRIREISQSASALHSDKILALQEFLVLFSGTGRDMYDEQRLLANLELEWDFAQTEALERQLFKSSQHKYDAWRRLELAYKGNRLIKDNPLLEKIGQKILKVKEESWFGLEETPLETQAPVAPKADLSGACWSEDQMAYQPCS